MPTHASVPGECLVVALNLTDQPRSHWLDGLAGRVVLSTHLDGRDGARVAGARVAGERVAGELHLRADEGAVIATSG